MPVEEAVIVQKLQSEGLSENLAKGLTFEDEAGLDAWVGQAKTAFTPSKGLESYTKEELKALADKGEFKQLQGLLDEVRTRAVESARKKDEPTPTPEEKPKPENDPLKALYDEIAALKKENAQSKFDQRLSKYAKGLEDIEIGMIKANLPLDATDDQIKSAVESYNQVLVKRGLKSLLPEDSEGAKPQELPSSYKEAIKNLKM